MIFDAFLLRALAGGIGLALVMGPLGCFVVWRRMAYFGDTLAHSALLGITLGTVTGLGFGPGIVIACLSVAVLLVLMKRRQPLAEDTLLGILAHSALSLGLVAMALAGNPRVDLMAYLFGDILAIHGGDLWSIWLGGAAVLAVLALLWRRLLTITVDEDLARVDLDGAARSGRTRSSPSRRSTTRAPAVCVALLTLVPRRCCRWASRWSRCPSARLVDGARCRRCRRR